MHLVREAAAGEGDEGLVFADPVPLADMDAADGAAHLGGDRLLLAVGKGAAVGAGDAAHGGGGALVGGQAAGVGHGDGDGAHLHVAGTDLDIAVDLGDGTGQGLEGAVQGDGGALAQGEAGRVIGGEGDLQLHGGGVTDGGHRLTGLDLVPHLHVHGPHLARGGGGHVQVGLVLQLAAVAALGLLEGDLRLLQGAVGVGGVQGVQHRALLHLVALLKVGGEDGVLQQGGDVIGVGGLQGAAAGDGGGHVPAGDLGGGIAAVALFGGLGAAAEQCVAAQADDQGRRRHQGDELLSPQLFQGRALLDCGGLPRGRGVGPLEKGQFHVGTILSVWNELHRPLL